MYCDLAMSSDIVILVRNLSKKYLLYDSPRHRLKEALHPLRKKYHRDFYALRDISLEVRRGETFGIIGRNGSGKSTLLKIITGVLQPSSGSVELNGIVTALLELGAGFNPEFTGIENIYFNGSIMGFSRAEMDEKLDDILAFADIGEFVHQKVKTYSSGMFVRLAFALSVIVDPDILVVDEALSVGDTFFQAKCMIKMRRMIDNEGTTLLYVSHGMDSVKSLCRKAILLDNGHMIMNGHSSDVVQKYFTMKVNAEQGTVRQDDIAPIETADQPLSDDSLTRFIAPSGAFLKKSSFQRINNGMAEFLNVILLDEQGDEVTTVSFGQRVTLRMTLKANEDIPILGHGYHIRDRNGNEVLYGSASIEDKRLHDLQSGDIHIIDWTFKLRLIEGMYTVACVLSIPIDIELGRVEFCDFIPIAYQFEMERRFPAKSYGMVYLENDVTIHKVNK